MGIRARDSGFAGVLESLSRGREGKGRLGLVLARCGLLGKGGADWRFRQRFRVRWCARKLVSRPRGQGQVGMTTCWVGTVGQRGGLSGDSNRRVRVLLGAWKLVSGPRGQGQVGVCAC